MTSIVVEVNPGWLRLLPLIALSLTALLVALKFATRLLDQHPFLGLGLCLLCFAPAASTIGALPILGRVGGLAMACAGVSIACGILLLPFQVYLCYASAPLLVRHRKLKLQAADGIEVAAAHLFQGRDSLVILLHGLAERSRTCGLVELARRLYRRWDVLLLELRGHPASGGLVDGNEPLDLLAALQYAEQTGYKRVALVGFSLGGITSLRVAGQRPVQAVVAIGIFGTQPRVDRTVQLFSRPWHRFFLRCTGARLGKTPAPHPYMAPAKLVEKLQCTPLLLLHSERDWLFPVSEAKAVYRAAPEPKRLQVFPGRAHGTQLLWGGVNKVAAPIEEWLNEHLSGQEEQEAVKPAATSGQAGS